MAFSKILRSMEAVLEDLLEQDCLPMGARTTNKVNNAAINSLLEALHQSAR